MKLTFNAFDNQESEIHILLITEIEISVDVIMNVLC